MAEKMLIIRYEQVEVFKEEARKRFAKRVLSHLQQSWPEKIESLGDEAAYDIIQEGIECAKSYGISVERDVFRFIALMFLFGTDFYRNQTWATNILGDQTIRRPSERMAVLCRTAEAQVNESNQSQAKELLNV